MFVPFWTGSFLTIRHEEGDPITWLPHSPDLTPLDFFLLGGGGGVVRQHLCKNIKCERVAECIPIKNLPIPDEKLSIILMYVILLMVPTLGSVEHIRNFVRSSV
jgi:hypothetical protein